MIKSPAMKHHKASALITTLVVTGVLLSLILTLISFTSLIQTQIARETSTMQLVTLGIGGINQAVAKLRADPVYAGETYRLSTGVIDSYVAPPAYDTGKRLVSVRVYVPNKTSLVKQCRLFRVQVNSATSSASIVKKTYEEINDPQCGGI